MRIAISASMTRFIDPIAEKLKKHGHEVRMYGPNINLTLHAVREMDAWADVILAEWADKRTLELCSRPLVTPVVVRLHSYEIFNEWPFNLDWHKVKRMIFVGKNIRRIYESRVEKGDWFRKDRPPMSRMDVIPNVLDTERFALAPRRDTKKIAYVADMNSKKNPGLALYCMKALVEHDSDYTLHVAGRNREDRIRFYMDHMIEVLGLERNVFFDGWIDELPAWLVDKEFCFTTSYLESFCYGIAEPVLTGCMPLVHHFIGAEDIYPEDWIFTDPADCVRLVREYEAHGELGRDRAMKANRDWLHERHNIELVTMRIEQLLENVVKAEGPRVPMPSVPDDPDDFNSHDYGETRYKAGHGSAHVPDEQLRKAKAHLISEFIRLNDIASIVDHGCGDGEQLAMIDRHGAQYTGLDISQTAIEMCRARFSKYGKMRFLDSSHRSGTQAELALSLSVIFHQVNDDEYDAYMARLFESATRFIIIYSTDHDSPAAGHMRNRKFTDWIAEHVPEWEVIEAFQFSKDPEAPGIFFLSKGEDANINMNVESDADYMSGRPVPIAKEFEPDKDGITLAMIVLDEEKGIARAIESAARITDDVVVLIDDKTTDNTEGEALRAGARVFYHTWPTNKEGGFGEARNRLHSYIKTKWVLVLDGHEYLEGNVHALRRIVDANLPGVSAILVDMEGEDAMTHCQVRLYEKDKTGWKEALHNRITVDGNGKEAGPSVRIIHDRMGGQTAESMRRRNLQRQEMHQTILPDKINREGNDTASIHYIQQHYFVVGAMEGVVYWGDRYRRVNHPKSEWSEERFVTMLRAGAAALELRDYNLAMDFAVEAVKADPRRGEGWALHADILFEQGLYGQAVVYYQYVETLGVPAGAIISVDRELHGSSWKLGLHIAMCYEHLGKNNKALEAYDKALEHDMTERWRTYIEKRRKVVALKMGAEKVDKALEEDAE